MLNYYYHPLLGLQYTYLGGSVILDIEAIPQDINFDADQLIKYVREVGVQWFNPSDTNYFQITGQITNYQL